MSARILVVLAISAAVISLRCADQPAPRPAAAQPAAGPAYRPADRTISLDVRPYGILCHGGRLYVTSFHDRKLLVLDERTEQKLHEFDNFDHYDFTTDERNEDGKVVGQRTERRRCLPGAMAIAGDRLFVVQTFGDSLMVFHAPTMHPVGRVKVASRGGDLAAAPDGRTVYFASNDQKAFFIIDPRSLDARRVDYPKGGRGIGALAVSPDGKRLYLGIQRGAGDAGADAPPPAAGPANPLEQLYTGPLLAVYDLAERRYVAVKSIGDTLKARGDDSSLPSAMAFSGDGRTLYIAMGQCMAGVHVFDTAEGALRRPITVPSRSRIFPWPGCRDVAVRGDDLYVVVGCNYELAVLDRRTRRCRTLVPLGGCGGDSPGNLALSERRAFVCHSALRRIFVLDLPAPR